MQREVKQLRNWRNSFPYPEARPIQEKVLDLLEENWNKYDVFVINAPTAFGKTALAKTLIRNIYNVSVITPTNLLVDQFLQEFPDTPSLKRLDNYECEEWKRPCSVTRAKFKGFCKGCPAASALSTAKYRRGPGIYNYHIYLAHKLYRDVLVVDEAHNLIPVIQDRMAIKLWQHDYRYPSGMYSLEAMRNWVNSQDRKKLKNKKLKLFHESVNTTKPFYIPERAVEEFAGKGTMRGEPEDRDLIRLVPVDIKEAPPLFWPREVQKIILLSATISEIDVEQMGLGDRRVCYIDCKSPIPRGNRPIIPLDLTAVNRYNMEEAVDIIANEIIKIADYHSEEKGVIHATYQMARMLRERLDDPRFIFHDNADKKDKYRLFIQDKNPRILVASGMYEGIDLPHDLGRWQVIAKIPWGSLGNPGIAYRAQQNPNWYIWETLKTTIQACGRVCRTPEDYGATYILDISFWKLYREGRKLIPEWFREAILLPEGSDKHDSI